MILVSNVVFNYPTSVLNSVMNDGAHRHCITTNWLPRNVLSSYPLEKVCVCGEEHPETRQHPVKSCILLWRSLAVGITHSSVAIIDKYGIRSGRITDDAYRFSLVGTGILTHP
ncbi:hypothetical protein Y032_0080g1398 [Ancylostoma ceylanicum]|uniref:Uncharacterized protein n=1 Tax=Ancylostoma ceylanicum TaxID=53326 RepID=A0A016TS19_9BILA|nr:hypothetical protein Y032_0080g1398 [Ancylostoma ceylanicum]